jgi:hypothetical protein
MLRRDLLKTLSGFAAAAAASRATSHSSSAFNTVVEVDKRLNRFILTRDVASAGELYDEDFLLTIAGGKIKRKADMLADIGNPAVALSVCETTDAQVRFRAGTAVLTGTLLQAGTVNGRAFDVTLHVTDTWVYVDRRWLLLADHASPA